MDGIIGHKKILGFLDQSVKNGKISHSYLFIGPSGVGKFRVAEEFAYRLTDKSHSLLAVQPDIHIIDQEEKIRIEQIRDLGHSLSLSPYNSKFKIAIINNIGQFSKEAANALLKTLEEPSPNSVLILIASNQDKILPTILSRCQIIRFYTIGEPEFLEESKRLNLNISGELMKLSAGRPGVMLKLLNDKVFYTEKQNSLEDLRSAFSKDIAEKFELAKKISEKEDIQSLLEDWLLYCREELIFRIGIAKKPILPPRLSVKRLNAVIRKIISVKRIIKDTNVNNLLAIENLLLEIWN